MKRHLRSLAGLGALLAVSLVFTGCGSENTITGADLNQSLETAQIAQDPLDGVMNSTDGFTPPDPSQRIDRLGEALGLSDEQKTDLLAAYTAFRGELEALRAQVMAGELTREQAKALAEEQRDVLEAEIQVILTPEQYDLLQEMRAARDGHGRHGRGLADRWDTWLAEIGADEAQVEAVKAALEALHAGMKDLRDQVQAGELTRDQAKEQAEALRVQFDSELQSILTEEQYAQLQELRPDCRRGGDRRGPGPPPGRR